MKHPKKWPVIRHVRYGWYLWRLERWWAHYGHLLGATVNPRDWAHLDAIWRGEA